MEKKIDFLQIGDGEEAREMADVFIKRGKNVSIIGFRKGIGQYVIHKTPDTEYFSIGKVNLRSNLHTSQLLDIRDYTDPVKWKGVLEYVLNNRGADKVIESVGKASDKGTKKILKEYKKDYSLFKHVLKERLAPEYMFLSEDCQMYGTPKLLDQNNASSLESIITLFYHLVAVEVIHATRERLEKNDLTEAEKLDDRGYELNNERRYKESLPYFDKSLKLSPKFCLAWINKGIALKNIGRIDEAISCYDSVINNMNHEYKKAWYNKANALFLKKDFDNARKCVDNALEIDSNYLHAVGLKLILNLTK